MSSKLDPIPETTDDKKSEKSSLNLSTSEKLDIEDDSPAENFKKDPHTESSNEKKESLNTNDSSSLKRKTQPGGDKLSTEKKNSENNLLHNYFERG